MREIITPRYSTLDGVVEKPHPWPPLSGIADDTLGAVRSEVPA